MFKFGFRENVVDESPSGPEEKPLSSNQLAAEVIIETKPAEMDQSTHHLISLCNDQVTLRKVEACAPKFLTPKGVDLVPGIYEGGFKLWEGAIDLAEYIYVQHSSDGTFKSETRVLELGAGHAIPGIMAANCGAQHLVLHDFNKEVIREVTAVNVHWNSPQLSDVRYFSGSWNSLPRLFHEDAHFDIILSAETVYGEDQIRDLATCILSLLKPGGIAWVSGKTYYFGIGGGIPSFTRYISKLSREKSIKTSVYSVREFRDGASNVREIVEVRRHSLSEQHDD